jgi:multisubunit Na+/H+ antiporter MnhG subunit
MQSVHEHRSGLNRGTKLWLATGLLLLLAAACYWYSAEHQSHISLALFWGLILACPLMHILGHGGHRHGADSLKESKERR